MPFASFNLPSTQTMIANNLRHIRTTIAQTALACDRDPETIQLVAVSKGMGIDRISQAIDCGQILFGENYLQEAVDKIQQLPPTVRWHFIDHLQSNKAGLAAELFTMVETVDRLKVAQALDRQAKALNRELSILVQVNTGREQQKSGVLPEETGQLLHLIGQTTDLRVCGLMTLPPYSPDPEKSRPYFKILRQLAEQCAAEQLFADNERVELSMGMSGDYPVAIEEGATIVRVGTALFGTR